MQITERCRIALHNVVIIQRNPTACPPRQIKRAGHDDNCSNGRHAAIVDDAALGLIPQEYDGGVQYTASTSERSTCLRLADSALAPIAYRDQRSPTFSTRALR